MRTDMVASLTGEKKLLQESSAVARKSRDDACYLLHLFPPELSNSIGAVYGAFLHPIAKTLR